MENKELIYEMAKRLDMIIEVTKEGKYIGKYRFINDKLHKLKEDEKFNDNSEKEIQDIVIGDKIISVNKNTFDITTATVTSVSNNMSKVTKIRSMYGVISIGSDSGILIDRTGNSDPITFLAKNLYIGALIYVPDSHIRYTPISYKIEVADEILYNITTNGNNTYVSNCIICN